MGVAGEAVVDTAGRDALRKGGWSWTGSRGWGKGRGAGNHVATSRGSRSGPALGTSRSAAEAGDSRCRAWSLRCGVSGSAVAGLGFLRAVGAVRLAADLQQDRSVHYAVQEGHRQRRIAQVIAPRLEVDVRAQGGGTLAAAGVDHLVEEVGRLGALAAFDAVEAELVDDHQVETRPVADAARPRSGRPATPAGPPTSSALVV